MRDSYKHWDILTTSFPWDRVYGSTVALGSMFARRKYYDIKVYLNKCHFLMPSVDFIGYQLSERWPQPIKKHQDSVNRFPILTVATEVRSFLRSVRFNEHFSPNTANLIQVLGVRFNDHLIAVVSKCCLTDAVFEKDVLGEPGLEPKSTEQSFSQNNLIIIGHESNQHFLRQSRALTKTSSPRTSSSLPSPQKSSSRTQIFQCKASLVQ